jgi:hypothetical protein
MAIVIVFGFALPFLWGSLLARRKGLEAVEALSSQTVALFRCQPITYFFSLGCALMGTAFFLRGMVMPRMDAAIFISALGVLFVIIGFLSTIRLLRTFVILCNDRVTILAGRKQETVSFDDIQKVFLISGHIVVDTGTVPRTTIPLIFSNWQELHRALTKRSVSGRFPPV